jgi:hypothetical protein
LASEPLEIAVCAQHNNGGLAGGIWWESTNIKHFFPIGEVNGSHGVNRPGGSALNSGQVGGFRAAEYIANCYQAWSLDEKAAEQAVKTSLENVWKWIEQCESATRSWNDVLKEIRERMSLVGAHIRSEKTVEAELLIAKELARVVMDNGCRFASKRDVKLAFRTRQLCFAHAVYLQAIGFSLQSKVGSRGSCIILDAKGDPIHEMLDGSWKILQENPDFRAKVLETEAKPDGEALSEWVDCRSVPEIDSWFETTWADFRKGGIYKAE